MSKNEDITILIVDDEEEILEGLRRRFELEDIQVETCNSSIKALELSKKHKYKIVITDIKMPEMNGIDFLKEIKQINPLCNVIMMTGYSNMTFVVECLSAGACDYFTKPFEDLDTLIDSVKHTIDRVRRWKKGMGFSIWRSKDEL